MSTKTQRTIVQKLTSRKFLVSLITAIAGIVTMLIGHEQEVATIAGALCTILPTLTYCIIEGAADIKSIQTMTAATSEALRDLGMNEAAEQAELVGDVAESFVDDETENEADKE